MSVGRNVAAGSVWESRMNEVKSGFKLFNVEEEDITEEDYGVSRNRASEGGRRGRDRRKTWKVEPIEVLEGIGGTPIQVRNSRSHLNFGISKSNADGVDKSSVFVKKSRSLFHRNRRLYVDDEDCFDDDEMVEKEIEHVEPITIASNVKKLTPEVEVLEEKPKGVVKEERKFEEKAIPISPNVKKQSSEDVVLEQKLKKVGKEERRKTWKPEVVEVIGETPTERKPRSDSHRGTNKLVEAIEKNPIYIKKTRSLFHRERRLDDEDEDFVDAEEEVVIEKKIEQIEKKSFVVKEAEKPIPIKEDEKLDEVFEKLIPMLANAKKQTPEVDNLDQKPKNVVKEEKKLNCILERTVNFKKQAHGVDSFEHKPKKFVEDMKVHQVYDKSIPISANLKTRQIHSRSHFVSDQGSLKPPPIHVAEELERFPETRNKLQNIGELLDLVMWKDVPKSALIFGLGISIMILSTYIEDFNFSLTPVVCYLGLLFLAASFFYRSLLCSGVADYSNEIPLVGEEEAICLLKMILPYFNEFLLKLRDLLSGEPATTMQLAVLLFVVAHCGSSINIWRILKLGFFSAFTLPKACSFCSTQLDTFAGNLWIKCSQDLWHSCPNKKAVAAVLFPLLWSFSSLVARIWSVFMVLLAIRYYQRCLSRVDESGHDEVREDPSSRQGERRHKQFGENSYLLSQ